MRPRKKICKLAREWENPIMAQSVTIAKHDQRKRLVLPDDFVAEAPYGEYIIREGDFLGLLANRHSNSLMDSVLQRAATYTPGLPVTGLKVSLGLEKHFPVLARSDHAS